MADLEGKEHLEQYRLLVEKLVNASEKKKDTWDKLSSVATVLAGPLISLVIAVVGWHFTNVYNQRQLALAEDANTHQRESTDAYNQSQLRLAAANAVGPFMPYITGKDANAKAYAVLVISRFDPDLGVQLGQAYHSPGGLATIALTGTEPARKLAFRAIRGGVQAIGGNAVDNKTAMTGPKAASEPAFQANPCVVGRIGDDFHYQVDKGEIVTITVTAEEPPVFVSFSDPSDGTWISASQSATTEQRRIQINAKQVSFVIVFSNTPNTYTVTMQDSKGKLLNQHWVVTAQNSLPFSAIYVFATC